MMEKITKTKFKMSVIGSSLSKCSSSRPTLFPGSLFLPPPGAREGVGGRETLGMSEQVL